MGKSLQGIRGSWGPLAMILLVSVKLCLIQSYLISDIPLQGYYIIPKSQSIS